MTRNLSGKSSAEFSDLRPDERFSRHEMVPGWSQRRLSESRVLVVGAGALGNEALKNLALLGVGELGIIDFDVIEPSNLSRCVLFQDGDLDDRKAVVAAKRIRELNPTVVARPLVADVMTEIGAGFVEEFDVVLGCLDNIASRYKLNRLCRMAGVPWLNAGIDAFCGQVSLFDPNEGACYECGMTTSMWQRVYERNSCLLPMRHQAETPLATTTILASLTGALQVQEAIAVLMGPAQSQPWTRLAAGDQLAVRVNPYEMTVLHLRKSTECMAHHEAAPTISIHANPTDMTASELLVQSQMDSLEVDWDIATGLECRVCGTEEIAAPSWRLREADLLCPLCSIHRRPHWNSRIDRSNRLAGRTLAELGIPEQAHLWMKDENGIVHHVKLVSKRPACDMTTSQQRDSV
jgi:molybdopterin/thiamine biosynthesis adenylyltransferase